MAKITMVEEYAFSAAHHLPTFPDGHKCRRVHGHTWTVEIHIEATVDRWGSGYAFDHAQIDDAARDVIGPLDHQLLNDIPGLERGLAEDLLALLVQWFVIAIPSGATLTRVVLGEMSGGSGFRLTTHHKVWTASAQS